MVITSLPKLQFLFQGKYSKTKSSHNVINIKKKNVKNFYNKNTSMVSEADTNLWACCNCEIAIALLLEGIFKDRTFNTSVRLHLHCTLTYNIRMTKNMCVKFCFMNVLYLGWLFKFYDLGYSKLVVKPFMNVEPYSCLNFLKLFRTFSLNFFNLI